MMNRFQYVAARTPEGAVKLIQDKPDKRRIIAGGLDLLGELKQHLFEPDLLIDISGLKELQGIHADEESIRIGSGVIIADIVENETIRERCPALAQAAAAVGSPQVRHVGTLGGNLCQRPRCWYYRDEAYPCLKKGGGMCYSAAGRNRYHAIFGGGPCFIVHPSDCAPALVALRATVHILGVDGPRQIPLEEFYILPNEDVTRENVLEPGELVTAVEIPANAARSIYLKVQERDGFDWALASVAVAMELDGRRCVKAEIVLGGVAPKPWRATQAEAVIEGKTITESLAQEAGEAAVRDAEPLDENRYKIHLTKGLVAEAILKLVA